MTSHTLIEIRKRIQRAIDETKVTVLIDEEPVDEKELVDVKVECWLTEKSSPDVPIVTLYESIPIDLSKESYNDALGRARSLALARFAVAAQVTGVSAMLIALCKSDFQQEHP